MFKIIMGVFLVSMLSCTCEGFGEQEINDDQYRLLENRMWMTEDKKKLFDVYMNDGIITYNEFFNLRNRS
jgi:hypothetical protein